MVAIANGNTAERITKLFDQLDPKTRLVLANAIYLKEKWQNPFRKELTADAMFADPLAG